MERLSDRYDKPGDREAFSFLKDYSYPGPLLPEGVIPATGFRPGMGGTVGKVEAARGKSYLVHKGFNEAYEMDRGLPLFRADLISTGKKAKVLALLRGRSTLAIGPYSRVQLVENIYNPKIESRETFLKQFIGKTRNKVDKLAMGHENDYRIITPTATIGVRGSEFAVLVAPAEGGAKTGKLATWVISGHETSLNFKGKEGPPVIIGPCSISKAAEGKAASKPMAVSRGLTLMIMDSMDIDKRGLFEKLLGFVQKIFNPPEPEKILNP
jgi:hypothetical protein